MHIAINNNTYRVEIIIHSHAYVFTFNEIVKFILKRYQFVGREIVPKLIIPL